MKKLYKFRTSNLLLFYLLFFNHFQKLKKEKIKNLKKMNMVIYRKYISIL